MEQQKRRQRQQRLRQQDSADGRLAILQDSGSESSGDLTLASSGSSNSLRVLMRQSKTIAGFQLAANIRRQLSLTTIICLITSALLGASGRSSILLVR